MANIDIASLFSDIVPNPEQQQRERVLQQNDAVNQANLVGTLGGMAAYYAPERSRALQQSATGLLGIQQPTSAADQVKAQLAAASSQKQTPDSLIRLAKLVENTDPQRAAQFRQAAAQMQAGEAALIGSRAEDRAIMTQAQQRIVDAAKDGTPEAQAVAREQAARLPALFANDPKAAREYVLKLEEERRKAAADLNEAGAATTRQRDQEIASRKVELKGLGLTGQDLEDTAAKLVDGSLRIELQEDGSLFQIDDVLAASPDPAIRATAVKRIRPDDPLATVEDLNPYDLPEGMSLAEAATKGTGVINVITEGVSRWASNFVSSAIDVERTKAKNVLNGADNLLIRAFSLNPRYPVAEQERIRETYGINPKLGESPASMAVKIDNLDGFTQAELTKLVKSVNDPTTDPIKRLADKATISELKAFRGIMFPVEKQAPVVRNIDDVTVMTVDDVNRYIDNTSEEDFAKLPKATQQAILAKMGGQ
jgi:hypothetical protein